MGFGMLQEAVLPKMREGLVSFCRYIVEGDFVIGMRRG
jgi:hypothetical protein